MSGTYGPADLLYARLPIYERAVSRALQIIRNAVARTDGRVAVSFSGGKDSLCALHLARQIVPDIPVAFCCTGADFPETTTYLDELEAQWNLSLHRLQPEISVLDMHGLSETWSWREGQTAYSQARVHELVIAKPMREFAVREHIHGQIIGVRADESPGRTHMLRQRSPIHAVIGQGGILHIYPLAAWDQRLVWAYIAANRLPYNPIYDRLTALGVPRAQQRVASWAGTQSATVGRFAVLKAGWPDLYQRFADAFPRIKEAT